MAVGIFQGSTPRLTFTPANGMKVADLGTPTVYIRQGLIEEALDATVFRNSAYVDLTAKLTSQLTDRDTCDVQIEWVKEAVTDSNGAVVTPKHVVRFPIHKVPVNESILPEEE